MYHLPVFNDLFDFRQGIDVNAEIDGRPPILYAADYGQQEVIEYLVSKGANVNVSIIKDNLLYHNRQFFTQ